MTRNSIFWLFVRDYLFLKDFLLIVSGLLKNIVGANSYWRLFACPNKCFKCFLCHATSVVVNSQLLWLRTHPDGEELPVKVQVSLLLGLVLLVLFLPSSWLEDWSCVFWTLFSAFLCFFCWGTVYFISGICFKAVNLSETCFLHHWLPVGNCT